MGRTSRPPDGHGLSHFLSLENLLLADLQKLSSRRLGANDCEAVPKGNEITLARMSDVEMPDRVALAGPFRADR